MAILPIFRFGTPFALVLFRELTEDLIFFGLIKNA
jgi:hypothetical protein